MACPDGRVKRPTGHIAIEEGKDLDRVSRAAVSNTEVLTTPPITSAPEQRLTAAALVQFCDLYRPGDPSVDPVRRCLLALDAGDIGVALTAFREVPLGGYGCFNDWLPADDDADYRLSCAHRTLGAFDAGTA